MEWGDVLLARLEEVPPTLAVRASTTKNSKGASIRLHPQLVEALEGIRPADAAANAGGES
jgi:hypothetical protein